MIERLDHRPINAGHVAHYGTASGNSLKRQ